MNYQDLKKLSNDELIKHLMQADDGLTAAKEYINWIYLINTVIYAEIKKCQNKKCFDMASLKIVDDWLQIQQFIIDCADHGANT